MENVDAIWQQLENPIPTCMELVSNSGMRIQQLEKQNETSTYIIAACLILLTGVAIYAVVEANRREMLRRMQ